MLRTLRMLKTADGVALLATNDLSKEGVTGDCYNRWLLLSAI